MTKSIIKISMLLIVVATIFQSCSNDDEVIVIDDDSSVDATLLSDETAQLIFDWNSLLLDLESLYKITNET